MASLASIRRRQNSSIEQINEAGKVLYGEAFELPMQGRDRELLTTLQMEYIANFLSDKAGINTEQELEETDDTTPAGEFTEEELRAMTNQQLKDMAVERGLTVAARVNKDGLVSLILSAPKTEE